MGRQTKANISQRKKQTREPVLALLDDVDDQPRSNGLSLHNLRHRQKKLESARQTFATRRILSTTSILRKRILSRRDGSDMDDRVYTDVYMDLDDGMDSGSGHRNPLASAQPQDEWEEEDASVEEQLLFFRTKTALQDFEFSGTRNRRDRSLVDNARWEEQISELVEAYMDFVFRRLHGGTSDEQVKEYHAISTWSAFGCTTVQLPIFCTDTYINTSYIRSGYLPINPLINKSLFSLSMVELYHNLFMRCPRLGIQPFLRAISDLQGVPFKNNLAVQFSASYDLYNRIRQEVKSRVLHQLGRDTPNWRMLNNCPCCQYEVSGEAALPIRMMFAIDGNNSLKRFQRREPATEGGKILGQVKERSDNRVGGGDYFLQPEQVDLWDEPNWRKWPGWSPKDPSEKVPCADRWSNMKDAKTKKSFGFFDVNGIFGGFCRHSFTIIFLDMIRTGEQSKYMLALLHHFMSACQEDRRCRGLPDEPIGSLGVGYDIACGMIDKIARSPLNDLAENERLQMLIGLLHGYAHNRLCQLSFLMLYIDGAGIEDLEVCERYFSQSNALAPVTRYMSKFHRRQAIANYAYHRDNLETYHNLSRFLYSNYKQALGIVGRSKETAKVLKTVGLLDAELAVKWLGEEKRFLQTRQTTPEVEILTASYYQSLVKLGDCQVRLHNARQTFRSETGCPSTSDSTSHQSRNQDSILYLSERQMVNEQEMEAKLVLDVQTLEERLGLKRDQRWKKDSVEWEKAKEMVYMGRYQRALDRLEGLIVSRIFELSKMNVAGTGYKMRQHIGNAMKKRSQTIMSALEEYNKAAAALKPPRKLLNWDDIMNYTYLSEFDFLRDTRADVREKPWAKPAVREAMSELFKLIGAGQELDRLHCEVQRLFTYMKDEEDHISAVVLKVQQEDPRLAHQIQVHGNERQRFNKIHRTRLNNIRKLKGFSPSDGHFFRSGIGIRRQAMDNEGDGITLPTEDENRLEESEDDEADGDADDRVEAVLAVADDTF